jgi:hypothetical protein
MFRASLVGAGHRLVVLLVGQLEEVLVLRHLGSPRRRE